MPCSRRWRPWRSGAHLAEEDHRRVREGSLRTGESLRMRFRCEPSLPVDVIGLIVLLPAPVL
jgi:hypothetical protein